MYTVEFTVVANETLVSDTVTSGEVNLAAKFKM